MKTITDEYMREMLPKSRDFVLVIMKAGPRLKEPGAEKIIWEHARRNFALRAEGILRIVCPVRDGSEVAGVGVFVGTPEEIEGFMQDDPAVREGILVFEVHPCRSFPGDALPA